MSQPDDRSSDAQFEVRNVLARIAQTADTGTIEEYLDNFTEDAQWVMPDNPSLGVAGSVRSGHAEIRAGVEERRGAGLQGPGSYSRHMVQTIAVTSESPDRATARSYFTYFTDTLLAPKLASVGQYDDTFVRTAAGWKLCRREITSG
ncbi:MAG: nuclear transport factor 2 family protein [Acidimicrobiia bacterium]